MDDRQCIRISELILRSYDGSAGPEDFTELESLLSRDRQAREYYVQTSMNLNYFHCLRNVPLSQPNAEDLIDRDFMSPMSQEQQWALLRDYAEHERNAPVIEIEAPEERKEREPIKKLEYKRPIRKISKFSLMTTIFSAAALLLMIIYVRLVPRYPGYEVATVIDSINLQWSSDLPVEAGTRITSEPNPIRLTRGIVKLKTDDQVQVVLEAPAEFYFSSYSEVTMNYGRLFACVSDEGYGFSVMTQNSKIVDLGTEFGVLSHINGNTEVHLYKGKANLFAGEKHEHKTSQLLTAGSARRIDPRNCEIREIALDEQALVRDIDSKTKFVWKGQKAVRLADLLLGGNGFGTASQQSIEYDPANGTAVQVGVPGYRQGSGKISEIPQSPYLDGIFVPGSGNGDVIISSAGHRFQECPKTSGLYYSNIICRKNCAFFDSIQQVFEQSKQQFEDPGFLYLHSNIGLTVDLNAVRHVVPGLRISSFSAYAGIINLWNNAPDYSEVDIWVLVDGQVKSSRKALHSDEGFDIHVNISDRDRFLTLVVTDGENINAEGFPANHFDTCGFAEPVFELVSP